MTPRDDRSGPEPFEMRSQSGEPSPQPREQRLERAMHRALQELPLRRAPATLQARVLRAIELQAGRPWWQRGFGAWPLAARTSLLACCCASVAVVLLGLSRLAADLPSLDIGAAIAGRLGALRSAAEGTASLGSLIRHLLHQVPPQWLLGGLVASALLYALLFGLVAIGYHLLYVTAERSGTHAI